MTTTVVILVKFIATAISIVAYNGVNKYNNNRTNDLWYDEDDGEDDSDDDDYYDDDNSYFNESLQCSVRVRRCMSSNRNTSVELSGDLQRR